MSLDGYASATSVPQGGTITFQLNSSPPSSFQMNIVKIGVSNTQVLSASGNAGSYSTPSDAYANGCGWPVAYTVQIPATWMSGLYRADFSTATDTTSIHFVVRAAQPGSTSKILLQLATTTYEAYNTSEGKSLYVSLSSSDSNPARQVSFDRPPDQNRYSYEIPFIQWLEQNGIVCEFCTSVDFHTDAASLNQYNLLLSVGHDEYWSKEMRDNVEAFVKNGGNMAFFSGNVCWWQVRFANNKRVMVCYKSAAEDPLTGVDNSRVTVNWFDTPVNRPENSMTGVSYLHGASNWIPPIAPQPGYTVQLPQHWVFNGTGLKKGDTFGNGIVGYETDAALYVLNNGLPQVTGQDGTPLNFQILATADLSNWGPRGKAGMATMGIFQNNGTVFTAATTDWSLRIQDPIVSQITKNVVQRLAIRQSQSTPLFAGYASATSVPQGGTITFQLNSSPPSSFQMNIVKIGVSNTQVLSASGSVGSYSTPVDAYANGCGWPTAYTLQIPATWVSGLYRADFSTATDTTSVHFVVRAAQPGSTSKILFQLATTIYEAFNTSEGKSLYESLSSSDPTPARQVSFDRPPQQNRYSYEIPFIQWLEQNGFACEFCTSIDLHTGAASLNQYNLLLSVGQDEYWSKEMRDNVEAFVKNGGNMAFFSGSTCWWQVRFANNNRVMVCYKSAAEDPLTGVDNSRVTVNWFDTPVNRPENSMTGVSYLHGASNWISPVAPQPGYTVQLPQHWVFNGTGLKKGDTFGNGIVGYVTDAALYVLNNGLPQVTGQDGTPLNFQILATADLSNWGPRGKAGMATMGIFQNNGTVFTAATTDWSLRIQDPIVSQITKNVIERLAGL